MEGQILKRFEDLKFKEYDAFMGVIKDTLAPNDDTLAYVVEEMANTYLADMFNQLERDFPTPRNCEFYSIEEGVDGKEVHLFAYFWHNDECWKLTEYTFCIIPIKEFVEGYKKDGQMFVDLCEEEVKQYEGELTDEEAEKVYSNYSENLVDLPYSEITEDTPCGNYRNEM